MNLYSNAIKFTSYGQEIQVKAKFVETVDDLTYRCEKQLVDAMKKVEFGALEVSITDTGIGISEDNQEKLFKMFGFLKDSQEKNPKGIGLGLHICKQVVQKFGGDIICRSKIGQGTTFAFLFMLNELTEEAQMRQNRYINPY